MSLSPTLPRSTPQSLFADLFKRPSVQRRHLVAPLLEERSQYLAYLLKEGVSRKRVRSISSVLINAIKLMGMKHLRPINIHEVQEAGLKWGKEMEQYNGRKSGESTPYNLTRVITKWLEFCGQLVKAENGGSSLDPLIVAYLEELRLEGYAKPTIKLRRGHLLRFQIWLDQNGHSFAGISLEAIDDYVNSRRGKGWHQTTLNTVCNIIRYFFKFCESKNLCKPGIARGIIIPRVIKPSMAPRGPAWKDVRRMLKVKSESPVELRANAIIFLCAIYALRSSEILNLRLDDFDWVNEIMTVRRAKGGPVQRFPIQHELGEAILAYLNSGRSKSDCRYLFTTFQTPIRQIGSIGVRDAVVRRMKTLQISAKNFGPHALRHSCATQLLNRGFSLREIADFLGHRGLRSVSIYAKYSPRLLRRVASFTLAGIQ